MVSFQCHKCGDVVKKPKLDQHRTRCHGGFDCIDCSTTFNSPAEYKGHTSCISEAEKYQKGLYKGPRTGESAPKNNYPPQPASEPYPGGGSSWGRGGFRGGRGGRGGFSGRGGWGQHTSRGTGANDTPLGTPNRMSPVTQSIPAPVKEVPVVESSNDSCKGKKRKSMGSEDTVPSNGDASSHKRAKKSKKEMEPPSMTNEVGEKEGKKRKKKEVAPADIIENDSEQAERPGKIEKKRKKEKALEDTINTDPISTSGEEVKVKKKKSKKSKVAEPGT